MLPYHVFVGWISLYFGSQPAHLCPTFCPTLLQSRQDIPDTEVNMSKKYIHCVECGAIHYPHPAYVTRSKYCPICRLLRDIRYLDGKRTRTRKCLCGTKFAPIYRDDDSCQECDVTYSSHRVTATCGLCGQEAQCLRDEIHVCLACAKDKDKRKLFLKALTAKQRQRREMDWPDPEPEPEEKEDELLPSI